MTGRPELDAEIVAFIHRAQLHDGVCPSYREIARYFLITTQEVMEALQRLQMRGHVRLIPRGHRAIEVVDIPVTLSDKLMYVFEQIDLMRSHRAVRCGACKGTGWQHRWNEDVLLVPNEPRRPCSFCGGQGVVDATNDG